MFVHRMHGVAAAALGALALGGCTDPALNTDLRPAGPPEVLAVLVMTDAASQLIEAATYCKSGDELRPTLVGLPDFTTQQVCPESGDPTPVTNAYPDGWYVRIMFDELLDPSFEELTPILDTDTGAETGSYSGSIIAAHPVTVQCRSSVSNQFVNVDYDGYYSPSGNRTTWPVGPSIVIKPNDPTVIATNTECQVTLNNAITDKQGESVPEAQRGPFSFKIAPITVVSMDPPVDDQDYESPIDAVTIYFDNPFVQFNTSVDYTSICPDEDDDGLCDDEKTFSIRDVTHPTQGPGYCDVTSETCGQLSDCLTKTPTGGDTLCGRGFCGVTGGSCNVKADCPDPTEHCGTSYAYDYIAYGDTDAEYGLGPVEPIETNHKYIFQFTPGAVLRDRCGKETTLPTPDIPVDGKQQTASVADDNLYARFITDKFDFNSTTIVTGEVASAMKRLQYNFNNVLQGQDTAASNGNALPESTAIDATSATPAFTITPLPKKLTAACSGTSPCPTADLAANELLIISPNADGQTQLNGQLQMNTEYTATIKKGTMIKDFYGVPYEVKDQDLVVKWKTQPAIVMTGIALRNTGQLFSTGNKGTLTKNEASNTTDIRFSFNASIDPTTFDLSDVKIEPALPGLTIAAPSGCGYFNATSKSTNASGWIGACTMRLRGIVPAGSYKITFLAGAKVKDIFGVDYTHPADTTITVDVAEAPAAVECL